jgi:hypothetical protein
MPTSRKLVRFAQLLRTNYMLKAVAAADGFNHVHVGSCRGTAVNDVNQNLHMCFMVDVR